MQDGLEIVRERFKHDRYAQFFGIVLDELSENHIRMQMELREDMLNWFERPHGGVVYSFADVAFSVLANNGNNLSVALDCSITYHAGPEPGAILVVEGETISVSRRIGSYIFKVYMEKEGKRILIATMKSIAYRTGKPIS